MPANNEGSPPGETAGFKDAALGGVPAHDAAIAQAGACDVSDLPPPPYPSKAKAGGFKFELDMERMYQSDTWAIANGLQRAFLFRLLAESWMQLPAGSLPDSDAVIAARIDMPLSEFKVNREILMRGWWKASDGRLYHPVITEQVTGVMARKSDWAARQRKSRETRASSRSGTDVTRDSDVSHTHVTVSHAPTTTITTNTNTKEAEHLPEPKGSSPQPILILLKDGSEYAITEAEIAEWTTAYPGMDVPGELRKARAWCIANPTKRKTRRGIAGFLNGWLARQPRMNGPPPSAIIKSHFENLSEKFANYNGPTVSLL